MNGLSGVDRDNEGFMLDPEKWNENIAIEISEQEGISLTEHHWRIIRFIRTHYEEKRVVPETRVVLRYLKENVSAESATRRHLHELFPYGYGQQGCKSRG